MIDVGIPVPPKPTPEERAEHERQYIIKSYKRQTFESLAFIESLRQRQVSQAETSAPAQE